MKVLVATSRSQGARQRDWWRGCVEGEMVRAIEEPCDLADAERPCSCETTFVGLSSHGLTTTATVRDVPGLTLRGYRDLLRQSLTPLERTFIRPMRYAEELSRVAAGFDEGEVVERWRDWLAARFERDSSELRDDVADIADLPPEEVDEARRDHDRGLELG